MKKIKLTRGKYVLVDDEDFEHLNQWKWCAQYDGNFYAARSKGIGNGKQKFIRMHRYIMNAPKGKVVDHINHNTLDNRKKNLRIASIGQNLRNQQKIKKKASSKYKGVSWDKKSRKWSVRIVYKNKQIYLGAFHSEIEAAKAYNRGAKKYHKEFAFLNKIPKKHKRQLTFFHE